MVARLDTLDQIQSGRVTCALRPPGGAAVRPRARGFVEGVAACLWTLPRRLAGKRVRATITVAFPPRWWKASRTVTLRVRG